MSHTKNGGLVLRSGLAVGAVLSVVSAFVAVPALMSTAGAASGDTCPAGQVIIVKFDAGSTSSPEYKNGFQPAGERVDVTNDKSWTWYAPNRDIYSVLVKGGQGEVYVKTISYDPPAHSGTVTSEGLVNNGGNQPAISHITLCGLPAGSATPTPTKTTATPTPTETTATPTPTETTATPTPTETTATPTPTETTATPTPTETTATPTPTESGSVIPTPSQSGSVTPSESGSTTPTTTPPVEPGSVTPSQSSSTPPAESGSATPTDPGAGPLPHTGADSGSMLVAAAAALLLGITLMVLGARKPRGAHRR